MASSEVLLRSTKAADFRWKCTKHPFFWHARENTPFSITDTRCPDMRANRLPIHFGGRGDNDGFP